VGVGPVKDSQAWMLEREIERKFKVKHAIAVNSGTAALHAGLVALGVAGRDVITSPYTFSATAGAVLLAGGRPVFADVDPHTFCITKETVKPLVTAKTAAILPVHLFGYMPDLSGLLGLGVPVLEDGCQSVGAVRDGRFSGTVGALGVGSFNGSKNVPAGEGGYITTNDDKLAERARLFVNHRENFGVDGVSPNYRMHELVACIARHGLRELEERNQRRRELANIVKELCPGSWPSGKEHVFYVMPFTLERTNRAKFIRRCAKRGLPVGAGYIQPTLDKYKAFRKYVTSPLPVAHELSSKTLCILSTLSPDKPLSYARKVAGIIREALK
jgi:perosamine synthetase